MMSALGYRALEQWRIYGGGEGPCGLDPPPPLAPKIGT